MDGREREGPRPMDEDAAAAREVEAIEDADEEDIMANDEEQARALEAFTRRYEEDRSWDLLQEDEHGRLRPLDRLSEHRAKRQRLLSAAKSAQLRRGMIRYLVIAFDLSEATATTDFRPTRLSVMAGVVTAFIRRFFDENPLSQLCLLGMRDGQAVRLTQMTSSPESHISKLKESMGSSGVVSLQNTIDEAVATVDGAPPYGLREVLVLFAGLTTCDPGNILDSVKAAKTAKCRISIVGLAAEVFVCKRITQETGGTYGVALDEGHLEQLVLGHTPPPATAVGMAATSSMVSMGFPTRNAQGNAAVAFVGPDLTPSDASYTCPQCRFRLPELPASCCVCGLTCVLSPQLARSFHHLFPVRVFEEVPPSGIKQLRGCGGPGPDPLCSQQAQQGRQAGGGQQQQHDQLRNDPLYCYGCARCLSPEDEEGTEMTVVVQCPACKHLYCFECDNYIHEVLHNCPGCEADPTTAYSSEYD